MASDRNDFRPPLYMSLPNQRYKLITASKIIKCLYEHAFEGLVIFTITKKRPWFVCIRFPSTCSSIFLLLDSKSQAFYGRIMCAIVSSRILGSALCKIRKNTIFINIIYNIEVQNILFFTSYH